MFGKIGLGTVQFGLPYGINNASGTVDYPEVVKIIDCYHANTIKPLYDTAIGYGDSQKVLGRAFQELGIKNPEVVSKFSEADLASQGLDAAVEKSLQTLKISSLYGFIAHEANLFIKHPALAGQLKTLKTKGLIKKTGASAYYPHEVQRLLDDHIEIDLVQVPYNIFDQRFTAVIRNCHDAGIEVHTRSAFLQGLIFKNVSFFRGYFEVFKDQWERFDGLSRKLGLKPEYLALGFCALNENISRIIIGVDNRKNLADNGGFVMTAEIKRSLEDAKESMALKSEAELLPFNWPK